MDGLKLSALTYIPIYCSACGAMWKLPVEKAKGLDGFKLVCRAQDCKGTMRRMPEDGQPSWPAQGFWPMSNDVAWMS
jgi:hypothetical protein